MKSRNQLLGEIVIASGGTITDNTRNGLLRDWLSAVGGDAPPSGTEPIVTNNSVQFFSPTGSSGTWFFGDESAVDGTNPVHVYHNDGSYTVSFNGEHVAVVVISGTVITVPSVIFSSDPWDAVGIPHITTGNLLTAPWAYDPTDDTTLAHPPLPVDWTVDTPGFYYIDSKSGSSGVTYGNPQAPLNKIPRSIPAGSVIVMAPGAYNVAHTSPDNITLNGTVGSLCWVIAADRDNLPVCNAVWEVGGNHAIIQDINAASINFDTDTSRMGMSIDNASFLSVRRCDWSGNIAQGGWGISNSNNVLLMDVDIHHAGDLNPSSDIDEHAVNLTTSSDVWIMNSRMHHVSGDSVQIGGQDVAGSDDSERIYVGRNVCYSNRQTAVWCKEARDVIVSTNVAYDFVNGVFNEPVCFGAQYDNDNVWFINNKLYDSQGGFKFQSGTGNRYVVGNLLHDLTGLPSFTPDDSNQAHGITSRGGVLYAVNNTLARVHAGISCAGVQTIISHNNLVDKVTYPAASVVFFEWATNKSADNNLYWGDPVFKVNSSAIKDFIEYQALGFDTNGSLNHNLGFKDSFDSDFTLLDSSPAVGFGVDSPVYDVFFDRYGLSIRKDMLGTERDGASPSVGAYEIGSVQISPPPTGTFALSDSLLTLTGIPSITAPSGATVTYLWTTSDGGIYTSEIMTHVVNPPSTPEDPEGQLITVTLVATSSLGGDITIIKSKKVYDYLKPNSPPVGTMEITTNLLDVSVTSDITDPDGDDITYNLDMGDGTVYTTASANHTYAGPVIPEDPSGVTHTVTMIATDTDGANLTLTEDVTVYDVPQLGQNLMLNGDFTTSDTSDWDANSTGSASYSIDTVAEQMTTVATDGNQDSVAFTVGGIEIGAQYSIQIEAVNTIGSNGEIKNFVGTSSSPSHSLTALMEIYEDVVVATSTEISGRIYAAGSGNAGDTVVIGSVRVRKVL